MNEAMHQLRVSCESCGAELRVEPTLRTARCPYCDSPWVVDRPATEDRPDPAFAVGFAVDRSRAASAMRRHLAGKWLAPARLKRKAAERVTAVYLPTYLYSTTAESRYSATIAEVYETTEMYTDSKGKTRMRRRRRTEHRDLSGVHTTYLGDFVVTASRGVANHEVEAVEPFDLDGLRRYTPALISGWRAEEPSLSREDSLRLARGEARGRVAGLLARFMPGDGHSNLRHATELRDESFDLVLLPVWVFAIRHREGTPPIRILVNGQTGAAGGKVPVSWRKVAVIAATVLGLVLVAPYIVALIRAVFS